MIELIEFDTLTKESLLSHIFLEEADHEIQKITTKPLAKVAMLGLTLCQSQNKAYYKAIKQQIDINMFLLRIISKTKNASDI